MLFDSAELPLPRWCGYCSQPLAATLENFSAHKFGRHGLATTCRSCANSDRTLRRRYGREHAKPAACPCGSAGPLQVDHTHSDLLCTSFFNEWLCRSCNLRARRRGYIRGPRVH